MLDAIGVPSFVFLPGTPLKQTACHHFFGRLQKAFGKAIGN
jgi:hypothetical protein